MCAEQVLCENLNRQVCNKSRQHTAYGYFAYLQTNEILNLIAEKKLSSKTNLTIRRGGTSSNAASNL